MGTMMVRESSALCKFRAFVADQVKVEIRAVSQFKKILPADCAEIAYFENVLKWGHPLAMGDEGDINPIYLWCELLQQQMSGADIDAAIIDDKEPFKSQARELLCADCENERCPNHLNYRKSANVAVTESMETEVFITMVLGASGSEIAFPHGCLHFVRMAANFPDWWAHEIMGRLRLAMPDAEILLGHQLQPPYLDKMRSISCGTCQDSKCKFSFKYIPKEV